MIRSWLTGRRDPFPTAYDDPDESGSAAYRLASELGADAQFTATIRAQWESWICIYKGTRRGGVKGGKIISLSLYLDNHLLQ